MLAKADFPIGSGLKVIYPESPSYPQVSSYHLKGQRLSLRLNPSWWPDANGRNYLSLVEKDPLLVVT